MGQYIEHCEYVNGYVFYEYNKNEKELRIWKQIDHRESTLLTYNNNCQRRIGSICKVI